MEAGTSVSFVMVPESAPSQIAGYYTAGNATYGFLYDDGQVTTFDFGGLHSTRIFGINNSGQMVGAVNFPGLASQALIVTPSPGRRPK